MANSITVYMEEHADELLFVKEDELVPVRLDSTWFFSEENEDGWNAVPSENASFTLKDGARFDLDSVFQEARLETTGFLYARLWAEQDGIALLGAGIDWWMEVRCNGIPVLDTWEFGNLVLDYSPKAHSFLVPVRKGENRLVFHVKRGTSSWAFACGTRGLSIPVVRPVVTRGPWLGTHGVNGRSIRFFTNGKTGAAVDYRKKGDSEWKRAWDGAHGKILKRDFHVVFLEGLEFGHDYEYRIVMVPPLHPEERVLDDAIHVFRMPEEFNDTFSLFYTADLQFLSPKIQEEKLELLLKAADARTCDLIALGGDIGNNFVPEDIFNHVYACLKHYGGDEKILVYLRGNHEYRGDLSETFPMYFGDKNGETYGIVRFGDTAFLLIDSMEDTPAVLPGELHVKYNLDYEFIQEETAFLKQNLDCDAWKNARRRVVLAHGAPYSHFDHVRVMPFVMQNMCDPYFDGLQPVYPLNLWLAGHTHFYTRSIPGTDVIAAPVQPPSPQKGGKSYVFPVLTVAGPNAKNLYQESAFRIDFSAHSIRMRAFVEDGTIIEDVTYFDDGSVTETVSLPHFNAPPLDNPQPRVIFAPTK